MPADLERRGIPVVVGGRPPAGGISYVDVDNRAGASSAVAHLASTDRSRIVTIAGPQDMPAGADRLAGFRETLEGAGRGADERRIEVADFSLEGGRTAMERLLERVPDLDAVFVASDLMAIGALEALGRAGRRVPDDVALVAYDDSPLAASSRPPLSSVRQPIEEMGREMTRLLLDRIRHPEAPPRHVILDTSLVLRESSRPM
jgi:DNA-binding LacI/PurR family transcriptional regulator